MADELRGMKVAFVATDGVEQIELQKPWETVQAAGAEPVLVSMKPGTVQGFNHLDKGDTYKVDVVASDADAGDYGALVLPGGVANPDALRTDPATVSFIAAFAQQGKPIAVICHGPWTLVEADQVRGRTLASWPSLQTDIRNAGGTWRDEPVVVCTSGPGPIVSSRKPDDLPAFHRAMLDEFAKVSTHS
jgi:deglycase